LEPVVAPPIQPSRESGVVIAIVGFVLLMLGAVRWNSVASQMVRGFGGSDGLGVLLLLFGSIGLATGLCLFVAGQATPAAAPPSTPVQTPEANLSVEARIRKLADLRSKELITDTEFDEKKRDILGSL
jgi:hypothetical protein